MTNSTQETAYYNNSTTSPVYLNEVKRITPERGDSYLACKAVLLDGPMDQPNYTNIDLNVKGPQAIEALESFEDQWPTGYTENASERIKAFASVRIGSISAKGFLKQDGTAGAVLKGKLMEVTYLKVNDSVLFSKNSQEDEASDQAMPEQDASSSSADQENGVQPSTAEVHSTAQDEGKSAIAA